MASGLDDVVAAETVLSDIDGAAGRLIIRGQPLPALAGHIPCEGLISLLLDGFFDDLPQGERLASALGSARCDVFDRVAPILPALHGLGVFDGVRAGVALMPDGDSFEDALRLIAAPAVLTPALVRLGSGKPAIAPDPDSAHATDILRMLGTTSGTERLAEALDTYLVTAAEHGLNASTFAARVVASTLAGPTSAVLAGLGALKGPRHGGAPGPVIAMLDAIAADGDAEGWLRREVASGKRLMGFGHRLYRARDPRVDALKAAIRKLADEPRIASRLAFAENVERAALAVLRDAKPGRVLPTNLEFYTAILLEAVGFPPEAFSAAFAMGRIIGWIAHAREQQKAGRLLRPLSKYVGPPVEMAA